MLHKFIQVAFTVILICTGLFSTGLLAENFAALTPKASQTPQAVWKLIGAESDHNLSLVNTNESGKPILQLDGTAGIFGHGGLKQNLVRVWEKDSVVTSWSMKMSSDYQFGFLLKTEFGQRQITYSSSNKNTRDGVKQIFGIGLGASTGIKTWADVKRNLSVDLQRFEPTNKIRAVEFVLIKSRGLVADFKLNSLSIQPHVMFSAVDKTDQSPNVHANTIGRSELNHVTNEGAEPEIAAAIPGLVGGRRVLQLKNKSAKGKHSLTIDGSITESAWHTAEIANDFKVSEARLSPTAKTEVRVLSDDKYLYFAFRNFDDNPDLVTAIKTLRDGGLGTDDSVSVSIDSYKDHKTAVIYSLNAIGTKDDQLPGGGTKKVQWKGDWKGAAVRTDYGWAAEIAIPFDILKFSADADSFGVNFSRHQNRTLEKSYWVKPTTEKQSDPLGLLAGLNLPQSKTGRVWTLMPYVVAGKNIYNRDGELKDESLHGGLTVKYEPFNNLTGLLEFFPDFSQVESQISDIDFSYSEKEVDDQRTFFQEGNSYFESESEYFYSPRIPDFDLGAKTFMQNDKNVLGLLITGSDDGRRDLHAKYRRNLVGNAGVSLTAVSGVQNDSQASLLAAGFDKKFQSGVFFDAKTALSKDDLNDTNTSAQSHKVLLGLSQNLWEIGINSDYYSADYSPPTALLKSDLPGTRSNGVYGSVYREGAGLVKEINGNVTLTSRDTLEGEDQSDGLYVSTDFEVSGKARLQLSYSAYDYRPVSDTPGVFQDTVNNDKFWSGNLDFNIYSPRFGYGGFAADGSLGGGDYRYLSAYLWFNPTTNTSLKISSEDLESFGRFKQTTISGGWDLSKNDGLIARLAKGDSFEQLRLAYRRKVSSGMDVFISYQKQNEIDDEYTGKFLWTF